MTDVFVYGIAIVVFLMMNRISGFFSGFNARDVDVGIAEEHYFKATLYHRPKEGGVVLISVRNNDTEALRVLHKKETNVELSAGATSRVSFRATINVTTYGAGYGIVLSKISC